MSKRNPGCIGTLYSRGFGRNVPGFVVVVPIKGQLRKVKLLTHPLEFLLTKPCPLFKILIKAFQLVGSICSPNPQLLLLKGRSS